MRQSSFIVSVPLVLLFCLVALGQETVTRSYVLRGTVIEPDAIISEGMVLVENGLIAAVGSNLQLPTGINVIDTQAVIAPGFIDLHDHLTWNVFSRWKPNRQFGTRYDWQDTEAYKVSMEAPHAAMVAAGLECEMERFAEVKALTQGATAAVGSLRSACSKGLVRNLDLNDNRYGNVEYQVFPLQSPQKDLDEVLARLSKHEVGAFLIHIAEGSPRSPATRREFAMMKARGLLVPGVSIIHGVALSSDEFSEMAAHHVGLIWSPRSNVELYGSSLDLKAAVSGNVTIAIAPDWSPTGSDGMLGELNYAALWNAAQPHSLLSDRDLVRMATLVPAELTHHAAHLGAIKVGAEADLVVIKPLLAGPIISHDAWWTVTHATPSQVALVTVHGNPLYGDPSVIQALINKPGERVMICGTPKDLVLNGPHGEVDSSDEKWSTTVSSLAKNLLSFGQTLGPLADCGSQTW